MLKNKLFVTFFMLIAINIIIFNATAADKKPHIIITPVKEGAVKTVIFDVGQVLFDVSSSKRISVLAPLFFWYPSLIYKAWTSDIKKELFTMLNRVPAHTQPKNGVMYNNGQQVPQIMVDWMNGRPNNEILQAIYAHIDEHDYTTAERALFKEISNFVFKADLLADSMEPIQPMIKLAEALKNKGYKLYILSNWDKESFPLVQQKHPQIFAMFDGIMISGTERMGKPHPEFYQRLLQRYNINPQESVFIDDEQFNTKQAEQLGIPSVWKKSIDSVIAGLEQYRILKKSQPSTEQSLV